MSSVTSVMPYTAVLNTRALSCRPRHRRLYFPRWPLPQQYLFRQHLPQRHITPRPLPMHILLHLLPLLLPLPVRVLLYLRPPTVHVLLRLLLRVRVIVCLHLHLRPLLVHTLLRLLEVRVLMRLRPLPVHVLMCFLPPPLCILLHLCRLSTLSFQQTKLRVS